MKRWAAFGICIVLVAAVLFGCGGGSGGGAGSPEELFEEIKSVEFEKMSQVLPYVAPDERSLLVFAMDFTASFALAFSSEEGLEEEYTKLRDKYGLPGEEAQQEEEVDLQDLEAVQAFAQKHYGKIDAAKYLVDVEEFLDKIPGQQESGESVKWSEMKDLKVTGDTASATIVLDDGNTEMATFLKVDGKWYFSQKAQMMGP